MIRLAHKANHIATFGFAPCNFTPKNQMKRETQHLPLQHKKGDFHAFILDSDLEQVVPNSLGKCTGAKGVTARKSSFEPWQAASLQEGLILLFQAKIITDKY